MRERAVLRSVLRLCQPAQTLHHRPERACRIARARTLEHVVRRRKRVAVTTLEDEAFGEASPSVERELRGVVLLRIREGLVEQLVRVVEAAAARSDAPEVARAKRDRDTMLSRTERPQRLVEQPLRLVEMTLV